MSRTTAYEWKLSGSPSEGEDVPHRPVYLFTGALLKSKPNTCFKKVASNCPWMTIIKTE